MLPLETLTFRKRGLTLLLTNGGLSHPAAFSRSLIRWLTYALIIHPIAAGMAGLSFILGVVSHFREFSQARLSTWVASLASTLAMLAFIFDMVAFTIAKSRLNSADSGDVALAASLGNGIWLTLAGFVLLFISSCAFGCGTRIVGRRPRYEEKEAMRPRIDQQYAAEARRDAQDLEKAERARRNNNGGGSGLPAFPEEEMPLTAMNKPEENGSDETIGSQDIGGVGVGYGQGRAAARQGNAAGVGAGGRPVRAQSSGAQTYGDDRGRQASGSDAYGGAEPFVSMYDQQQPQQQQTGYDQQYHQPYQNQNDRQGAPGYDAYQGNPYAGQQMGYSENPGIMAMPTAEQHGGREAGQIRYASPNTYGQRPVDDSYYGQQAAAQYYPPPQGEDRNLPSNLRTGHRNTTPSQLPYATEDQPTPWHPPTSNQDRAIDLSTAGQASFYDAAADARAGAASANCSNPGSRAGHRPAMSDGTYRHGTPSAQAYHAPSSSDPYGVNSSQYYRTGFADPASRQQGPGNPAQGIPYAPNASHTPAPTYYTNEGAYR